MNKSINITRWVVFGLLIAISLALVALFFWKGIPQIDKFIQWRKAGAIGQEPPTTFTDYLLNWSYIKVALGVVVVIFAFVFSGIVKGLNWKTLLIALGAIAVIGIVAYVMSKGAFSQAIELDKEHVIKPTEHGLIEMGLNFFYITFGVAVASIVFSVIYKMVKR